MGFVYLDDHWDEHPKFLGAFGSDPQSIVLYISSLSFCRRAGSGGLIDAVQVKRLLGYRLRSRRALVQFALWEEVPGHDGNSLGAIEVHDYAQWNRTAEERSASARNAAQVRWRAERARRNASRIA